MTTDVTALLVSILLLVLIAGWVPFLDFCSGCLGRWKQGRAVSRSQAPALAVESPSGSEQLRQAFTRRLLASQETERKRIAHDLYDSLGQHLALISNLAQPSRKSEVSPLAQQRLTQIQEEAGIALREVQHISYNLRPYQLDRLGLTRAVLSLVRGLEETTAIRVDCDISNIDNVFPQDLEINFYRIVQESLSNIARHSGAGSASVHVTCSELHVGIVIQDDGVGFSGAGAIGVNSLGLVGIAERAELLGGTAVIESIAGQGTTITVHVRRNFAHVTVEEEQSCLSKRSQH